MDVLSFTEDQDSLRSMLRAVVDRSAGDGPVTAPGEQARIDTDAWRRLSEAGIASLGLPSSHGGDGSIVDLCLALEETGRRLLVTPHLATSVLAGTALAASDDTDAMDEFLPRITRGEIYATLAFAEPDGSWDPAGIAMTAESGPAGYTLSGQKTYVLDGDIAELVVVAAVLQGRLGLFLVDTRETSVSWTALPVLDRTRPQAILTFDGTPARVLGRVEDGTDVLEHTLSVARTALAAEAVGSAQFALDTAVSYAKERVQFGRPIGSFQAIKHKCADMLLRVEGARSAAYYAAFSASSRNADYHGAASLAKSVCSETLMFCAQQNIQIHGGIGFCWDHSAHLYYRRAKSCDLLLGDVRYLRELYLSGLGV